MMKSLKLKMLTYLLRCQSRASLFLCLETWDVQYERFKAVAMIRDILWPSFSSLGLMNIKKKVITSRIWSSTIKKASKEFTV